MLLNMNLQPYVPQSLFRLDPSLLLAILVLNFLVINMQYDLMIVSNFLDTCIRNWMNLRDADNGKVLWQGSEDM